MVTKRLRSVQTTLTFPSIRELEVYSPMNRIPVRLSQYILYSCPTEQLTHTHFYTTVWPKVLGTLDKMATDDALFWSAKSLFNCRIPWTPKTVLGYWVYLGWINIDIVLGVGRERWTERPYVGKSAKCSPQAAQTLFVIYIRDSTALRLEPLMKMVRKSL